MTLGISEAVWSSWTEQLPELRGLQRGLRVTAAKNLKASGALGRMVQAQWDGGSICFNASLWPSLETCFESQH